MYSPSYDVLGQIQFIQWDDTSIPLSEDNRHYRRFLSWLKSQNKTLQEWLSENPYVPPTPTQDEIDDETEKTRLRTIRDSADLDNLTVDQMKAALKWLLKREFRRIK